MRRLLARALAGASVAAASTFAFALGIATLGCDGGSSGGAPLDEAGVLASTDRPPGTTCEKDGGVEGGHTYSSGVCAESPGIPGCRMCLDGVFDAGPGSFCVYACHVGAQGECPSGQTCTPQPNAGRSSSNCDTTASGAASLGYCR